MASAQVELKDQLQNGTTATLNNHTVATMQLIRSHTWSGNFTSLPKTITSHGGVARIDHLKGSQGSKAGVSYSITSAAGAPYSVILAWNAPTNFNPTTSPNRLFGICGPKATIDALSWDNIGQQLDRAGSSVVINDEASKISVHSTIITNPKTNMANVPTNFLLMP
ncbi:jasmonate-induced protein homolog [Silene latifolia]|uniref:jasmonate-induced protein homolog n=1 Tax=Silene latifolia TaxID=37657 RepID=UPI003D78588D